MFKKKYILIFLIISTLFFPTYFLFLYEGPISTNEKMLEKIYNNCDSYGYDNRQNKETDKHEPYNFLKKYPIIQSCTYEYNKWQNDTKLADYYNYTNLASSKLQSKRFTRGIIIYFPIESFSNFFYEFKWLYRSWIEMQKHEPTKWRTDLILFIDNNQTYFNDTNLFFNRLNCTFSNRRKSKNDPPMCTLIEYKSFFQRNFNLTFEIYRHTQKLSKVNVYELILKWVDIFKKNNQD